MREQSERRNSAFNAAGARYFNDFIAQAELHMGGGKFTYMSSGYKLS